MGKKFGFSFSAKRASGLSGIKGRISRNIGIPLTRSGRQRAVGRASGCCVALFIFITSIVLCFLVFIFIPVSGGTHSGGLDSNGGHYNRKTGEYHYHRGGPAADSPKAATSENKTERKAKAIQSDDSKKKKSRER